MDIPEKWVKFGFAIIVTLFLVFALKELVQQPRPEGAPQSDYGFPSGHAAVAFAIIPFVLEIAWLTIPLATLIGFQRVILGYHTIPQVVAGAAIGFCIGYIVDKYFSYS